MVKIRQMTLKEYSQYKHEPNWKLINMNKTKKRQLQPSNKRDHCRFNA
ncbi:hypothetical protein [Paenibacillus alvei]|nr:hypothetical protein [Paenibacillus alvei]